jgi:DNA-binding NarL/FixJ family response regulator
MIGPIRIVIADDHVVLRVGLRSFLEEQKVAPIAICGEASDGHGAIALVEKTRPDLLLLDLSMEGLGGLETILELRRRELKLPILVLTQHAESVILRRVLEAGANGYILKSARGDDLVGAIRAVAQGGTWIEPSLAGALVSRAFGSEKPMSDEEAYSALSPREQQVLKLVAEGLSNKEIAVALDLAVKTVMTHRANLMDKLGIRNRSRLIRFAIRVGLLTDED